ncbi:hypothetical protein SGPA1_40521 [Streptomyces misionensis JCM 4497]
MPRPGGGARRALLVMDCVPRAPRTGVSDAAALLHWSRDDHPLFARLFRRLPHTPRPGRGARPGRADPDAVRAAARVAGRRTARGRRRQRRRPVRRSAAGPGPYGRRRPAAGGRRPARHPAGKLAGARPDQGGGAALGRCRPVRGGRRPAGGAARPAAQGAGQRRRGGARGRRAPLPAGRRPAAADAAPAAPGPALRAARRTGRGRPARRGGGRTARPPGRRGPGATAGTGRPRRRGPGARRPRRTARPGTGRSVPDRLARPHRYRYPGGRGAGVPVRRGPRPALLGRSLPRPARRHARCLRAVHAAGSRPARARGAGPARRGDGRPRGHHGARRGPGARRPVRAAGPGPAVGGDPGPALAGRYGGGRGRVRRAGGGADRAARLRRPRARPEPTRLTGRSTGCPSRRAAAVANGSPSAARHGSTSPGVHPVPAAPHAPASRARRQLRVRHGERPGRTGGRPPHDRLAGLVHGAQPGGGAGRGVGPAGEHGPRRPVVARPVGAQGSRVGSEEAGRADRRLRRASSSTPMSSR